MARRADKLREELAALDQEIGTAPPSGRQMHKAIPVAIAFLTLFSFGGMTWYAYNQGILEGSETLISEAALKVAPSSPGGVQVLNRDKFVYNQRDREDDQKVERLLPPPEQPKHPPHAPATPARPPSRFRNPLYRVGRQKIRLRLPWQNRNQAKHSTRRSRGRQMRHFGKLLSLLTKVLRRRLLLLRRRKNRRRQRRPLSLRKKRSSHLLREK